jgi:hypothetical protein
MDMRSLFVLRALSSPVAGRSGIPAFALAWTLLRCMLATVAVLAAPQAHAQNAHTAESVKAAYLFHFAGYVEWPEAPDQITIGVLGDSEVARELKRIVPGRSIENRSLQVRNLRPGDDLSEIHVLYVGRSEAASLPALVEKARRHHLLLVADAADALNQGAAVNFVTAERRIRFEISQKAAEEAGLKLSSRLLSAALRLKRSFHAPTEILATPLPALPGIRSRRRVS